MIKDKISTGNCGEYFVAAELERHGFTAAVPMSNTRDYDILAISREDPNKQYAIQVKTNTGSKTSWILKDKNEKISNSNVFYVFVNLNDGGYPDYYVVPSKIVVDYISENHQIWLNTPGKKGQKHNNSSIRTFRLEKDSEYRNAWESL
jgi:hypothetical protein